MSQGSSPVIYVDELVKRAPTTRWPYKSSCHMLVHPITKEGLYALHAVARLIGLREEWFQQGSYPHYDLTATKRYDAVKLGAVEITAKDYIELCRKEVDTSV